LLYPPLIRESASNWDNKFDFHMMMKVSGMMRPGRSVP